MSLLTKLKVFAVVGFVGCLTTVTLFQHEVSKSLLKSPKHNEVMEKIRAHKGAMRLLGEPVEALHAKYNNFSMKTDGYAEIKLNVTGSKSKGVVFYTITVDKDKNLLLNSIQIQLEKDDTRRLVVFDNKDNIPKLK